MKRSPLATIHRNVFPAMIAAVAALHFGCGQERTTPSAPDVDISGARIPDLESEVWPEAPYSRIETFMGTGIASNGPDGLPPLETGLYLPVDYAFGSDGRHYVVDWNNHKIRRVIGGLVYTVLAGGEGPPDDDLNHPTDVSFDEKGFMYVAAWHNSRVLRMDLATDSVETICGDGTRGYGGDDGPAIDAILNLPVCVLPDPTGRIFITDESNQRIRVIGTDGIITTYAGNGTQGFSGDGGPATEAQFNFPSGQVSDPAAHFTLDESGNMYVADTNNHRIRRIDTAGIITTVVGNGTQGFSGDNGPALEASLRRPVDVAIGPDGNLYIADTYNHCVRMVDLATNIITTIAGTGTVSGSSGDGGRPKNALLNRPYGIGFDDDGNLYIADTINNKIRVVYR